MRRVHFRPCDFDHSVLNMVISNREIQTIAHSVPAVKISTLEIQPIVHSAPDVTISNMALRGTTIPMVVGIQATFRLAGKTSHKHIMAVNTMVNGKIETIGM